MIHVTSILRRRMTFDVLVPEEEYRTQYNRLKDKYGRRWVEAWPEQTDPQKFVYEEIGIAAYLLCVWRRERAADPEKWRDPDTGVERLQVRPEILGADARSTSAPPPRPAVRNPCDVPTPPTPPAAVARRTARRSRTWAAATDS